MPRLSTIPMKNQRAQSKGRCGPREDRWHLWVDRVSRLPRPLLLVGIVAILVWPAVEPESFVKWCNDLAMIPEPLWTLIFCVAGSWAGTKAVRDWRA